LKDNSNTKTTKFYQNYLRIFSILIYMFNTKISLLLTAFVLCVASILKAQPTTLLGADPNKRPIVTAVPFLNITPDSRSGAMGDVGVAISPDANSVYWNPAKLPFAQGKLGVAFSYNPWLRNIVNDMSLSYLSGYYKLDNRQAVGFELRYFDMGSIQFTDNSGNKITDFRPSEFALGGSYARKLSEDMGISVSARFIYSNLSGDFTFNQQESKPGSTGAADIAWYYKNDKWLKINNLPATLSFGANISNIGAKISYINKGTADFIPTNLRLGSALEMSLDPESKNKLTVAFDANKLLVPTPPQLDANGNIVAGTDPRQKTVLSGIFGSFTDAPNGFREELQEFTLSLGAEYNYNNLFFARAGYFGENANKGNRKYFTVGAGFKYQSLGLDVSYLLAQGQSSPLGNTIRFTLSYTVNKTAKEKFFDGDKEKEGN
jgi:hypothetical protein